ncbi:MAG: hypothetical protein O3B21_06360 [Proteobacteria bacterium]|nr:hypothetical protein [Pseudomonadota bacterium]MDA1354654.1 hypothetical protein [Pseudomonadota bacterium]
MASASRLPELSEQDAGHGILAIYDEIKACCRVPMVALIYRHLATHAGVLEWSWRVLAPAMRSGALSAAAQRAATAPFDAALPALTPEAASALSLKPMDLAAIAYIATAYNTANPHNIIAVRVLMAVLATDQAGGSAGAPHGSPVARVQFPALPPLVQLEDMPPALAERIGRLRVAGDDGSRGIVPTLYRHLAHWPDYLMASAEALEPLFLDGKVEAAASSIAREADAAAARLSGELMTHDTLPGRPTGAARQALLATLGAFAATIPEMIAVGRLLTNALPREN